MLILQILVVIVRDAQGVKINCLRAQRTDFHLFISGELLAFFMHLHLSRTKLHQEQLFAECGIGALKF